MRKRIAIICLTAMVFNLAGCKEGQSYSKFEYSNDYIEADISILAKDLDSCRYFYVIDNNTGVVYLQFDGFRRAGITVALNADGTPITIDQIKAEEVSE